MSLSEGGAKIIVMSIKGNPKVFAPYERIIAAISKVLETKEECFPSDLDDSFTDDEVKNHWRMAYALAQV